MYLVLLIMSSNMYPSDLLWSFAFVNSLAAASALRRPSTRRIIAILVGLDLCCGLVFSGWAFWQDWMSESVRTAVATLLHSVSGFTGIAMALWVYSGNRRYEAALPLRGRWAARFFAAIAVTMMHYASLTYYTSLNLTSALGRRPFVPTDDLTAAVVAVLTLPGYYFALWGIVVEGRPIESHYKSADSGKPQRAGGQD